MSKILSCYFNLVAFYFEFSNKRSLVTQNQSLKLWDLNLHKIEYLFDVFPNLVLFSLFYFNYFQCIRKI